MLMFRKPSSRDSESNAANHARCCSPSAKGNSHAEQMISFDDPDMVDVRKGFGTGCTETVRTLSALHPYFSPCRVWRKMLYLELMEAVKRGHPGETLRGCADRYFCPHRSPQAQLLRTVFTMESTPVSKSVPSRNSVRPWDGRSLPAGVSARL
jgi:hypothetical protein